MAGNSEVIMRLERMMKELAVKNERLERRVAELEERTEGTKSVVSVRGEQVEWLRQRIYDIMDQLDETDAKAEMLIGDVALLDDRTQSLNKEGRRCSD